MRKVSLLYVSRVVLALAVLLLCFASVEAAAAQTRSALSSGTGLYARSIRLAHNAVTAKNGNIVVSVTAFPGGVGEESIYNSTDGGVSFQKIGAVHDTDFSGGLCCGTLYELPSAVGTLQAGTLLWAGSVGQSSTTQDMQLKVYASADAGVTWSYLSNCATSSKIGSASGGIWEPEFEVANDGALVCFYSDETQTGHSQLLEQTRTYDGVTWQAPTYMVASSVATDRPGMAVVSKLPSGLFFMTYELCGPAGCTVFYRTSTDGWNWGSATNVGTRVQTAAGQWLEHAPYNVWVPSATSANGTILLVGQMMYDSSGSVSSGNGITILTNHSADGSGSWSTMPAPVKVPTAYNNYCPNYSSPLLPSVDGTTVLELASDYVGTVCTMFYGSGPILAGTVTPTITATPASPSVVRNQTLPLSVTVAGVVGDPAPTGTVVLTSGTYTSAVLTLTAGVASATVPANTFAAGSGSVVASYSGDANYLAGTLRVPVTATAPVTPTVAVTGTNVTVAAGATTGNVSTITVTPSNGFTGAVTLSAQVSSGPTASGGSYPTLTFSNGGVVNVSGATPVTATLTVGSTTRTSAGRGSAMLAAGMGLLAAVLVCPLLFEARRLRRAKMLMMVAAASLMVAVMSGCSGGGSGSTTTTTVHGTPAGSYLVTVMATSSAAAVSAQVTVVVQ